MSLDSVRAFLAEHAPDLTVIEHDVSTATVIEAAAAHGCSPGQIAKTLSLRVGDRAMLVVTRGDARLHNRKARTALGGKPRMLAPDEVAELTGHPVGGVSPFGLAAPLPIYCDVSLRDFDVVIPAAGSPRSSVRVSPGRMADLVRAEWIDVCEVPD